MGELSGAARSSNLRHLSVHSEAGAQSLHRERLRPSELRNRYASAGCRLRRLA